MLESCLVEGKPGDYKLDASEEVIEVGLLLSPQQLRALEAHARQKGLTTAVIMRQILRDYLHQSGRADSGEA